MSIVFRVMPTIVCPLSLSQFTMNVFGTFDTFRFTHDGDVAFDEFIPK